MILDIVGYHLTDIETCQDCGGVAAFLVLPINTPEDDFNICRNCLDNPSYEIRRDRVREAIEGRGT